MTLNPRHSGTLTTWTFVALVGGTVMGFAGRLTQVSVLWTLADAVRPLGALWINALQMVVIPLVITQILRALVRPGDGTRVAGLGGRAVGLFVTLLAAATVFTVLAMRWLVGFLAVPPDLVASLHVESIPEAALEAARTGSVGLGAWIRDLVPRNPLEAAASGNMLQVLLFTVLFGAAAGRLPDEPRAHLASTFEALADATLVLVGWVLLGTPVGVFSLMLGLSLETGMGGMSFLLQYLTLVCGLLTVAILLLYPLAVALGRVPLASFVRALAPAQVVAVSTQSSLASLPALIQGAREHLDLPEEATSFVLPLSTAVFKLNQGISPMVKFLFLGYMMGVPLGWPEIGTFAVAAILLSFGVPGIPRGSPYMTLPLFIAAGVPVEAVVIIEAVKTIPDLFMTTLNVTADMSVATLLSRGARAAAAERRFVPAPGELARER